MTLDDIVAITKPDMNKVNYVITEQLNSDVILINQLGHYIIDAGGKRIRPITTILAAKALGYTGENHIIAAAFIEFIHTATLLHDDVVDESDLRRGVKTANALFGNAASVLVGDFIYTRAFQMMTSLNSLPILSVMSSATNVIAEGEVQQLINCNDPNTTEKSYLQVIYSKTARLFEAATHIAALLSHASLEHEQALQQYGRYLGTAFQLIDDLLDYTADNKLGKNIGDDLQEGKPTLPLIHALKYGNENEKALINQAIMEGNGRHLLGTILNIMERCGSLEYTQQRAIQEAQKAIESIKCLPPSEYKEALIHLAKISTNRVS